jgi:hypothetical protein
MMLWIDQGEHLPICVEAEPIDIGVIKGELAVHETLYWGWGVTHIASGHRIGPYRHSRDDAIYTASFHLQKAGKERYESRAKEKTAEFQQKLRRFGIKQEAA